MDNLDEPIGDSSILPTYLLCKETRKYVTVALGGDGSDELFAGYDPFRALKLGEIYNALTPVPLHEAIKWVALKLPVSLGNMSFDFKIKRTCCASALGIGVRCAADQFVFQFSGHL